MTRASSVSALPPLTGEGAAGLRKAVEELRHGSQWPLTEPLPTTRELAECFGVSNATMHRTLSALEQEGVLWRSPGGRFYFPGARRLLARPRPVACLLRRMEVWTEVSRLVIQGADAVCGNNDTGLLLIHDRVLHRQRTPQSRPQISSVRQQREALEDFIAVHQSAVSGVLLDELWDDEALEPLAGRLGPAVVLYRTTALPTLGNVAADFEAGALLAVSHLFARGYEDIILVQPFAHYAPAERMIAACEQAVKMLHARSACEIHSMAGPSSSAALIRRLTGRRRKTAVICPEDNFSLFLQRELQKAGLAVPERVGLLSCMGTSLVQNAGVSSLVYDFAAMGAQAASLLCGQGSAGKSVQPALFAGGTT